MRDVRYIWRKPSGYLEGHSGQRDQHIQGPQASNMPEMLENHMEVSAARTEGRAREGRNEDRRETGEMGEIV